MNSLYAYFGLLDLHTIDSPGHTLYQLGLIDKLQEEFLDPEDKFDFLSYYPKEEYSKGFPGYPTCSELGYVFNTYRENLIDTYCIGFEEVLNKIEKREYEYLFLKARFRNLSTLTKKWKDTAMFEKLINAAILNGYDAQHIVIVDTDLSLPESFVKKVSGACTIVTAQIACSKRFLLDCAKVHLESDSPISRDIVFYGNVDTSSYKAGNEKNPILTTVLEETAYQFNQLSVIVKAGSRPLLSESVEYIDRHDRERIWEVLSNSSIMINVSKDKYDTEKFIPARVYEALIFGMIPVSFKFEWLCSTFSFSNIDDYFEIIKYLREIDDVDFKKAYQFYINKFISVAYDFN